MFNKKDLFLAKAGNKKGKLIIKWNFSGYQGNSVSVAINRQRVWSKSHPGGFGNDSSGSVEFDVEVGDEVLAEESSSGGGDTWSTGGVVKSSCINMSSWYYIAGWDGDYWNRAYVEDVPATVVMGISTY